MKKLSLYNPLGEEELLFFLHVPKTAGISFNYLMVSMFEDDEVMTAGLESLLEPLRTGSQYNADPYKYLRAHIGFVPNGFFSKPTRTITFFRDPVSRCVSAYKHIVRNPNDRMHTTIKFFDTFVDFMHSTQSFSFRNTQARLVSGYFQLENNAYITYRGKKPYTDPLILEKAKENLEELSFWGFLESYDESLKLLEHIMGWDLPVVKLPKNKAPKDQEINFSEKDLDVIRYYNQLDIEFYDYAQKLYLEKIERMIKEKQIISENKIPIEIRSSKDDVVDRNFDDIVGHCPVCDQSVTFLGPDLVCSNCNSIPETRAVKLFLDEKFPEWEDNMRVHEYDPRLLYGEKHRPGHTASYHYQESEAEYSWIQDRSPYDLPIPENSTDIIISINTIDCMMDPHKFIDEAIFRLKSKGLLILTVPFTKTSSDEVWIHRATEISGEPQPLKRIRWRKSPNGERMILFDFSPDSKRLFASWANQAVDFVKIKSNDAGLPMGEQIIILVKKIFGNPLNRNLIERLYSLWGKLEISGITNIDRLNIYHAIKENQEKIISDLKYKLINMNEDEESRKE